MEELKVALATAAIRGARFTPFRGRGGGFAPCPDQQRSAEPRKRFRQAYAEAAHIDDFYRCYPELPGALAGKDVLDFGCGYGGKTVEYSRYGRSSAGIEPFDHIVRIASEYARHRGRTNVQFRTCDQASIPFPDASFDVVLSHDVLEHVENPEVSLREIERVLRPSGKAYIVFPPYDGMFSHHLDYAALLPGLHWLFSARTLVNAVNRSRSFTGMGVQPEPKRSWDGGRDVLPTLNGLTGAQFEQLAATFGASLRYQLVGHSRRGWQALIRDNLIASLAKVSGAMRDRMTHSVVALLEKRGA
jgi:SAM-dependent methyltransferase